MIVRSGPRVRQSNNKYRQRNPERYYSHKSLNLRRLSFVLQETKYFRLVPLVSILTKGFQTKVMQHYLVAKCSQTFESYLHVAHRPILVGKQEVSTCCN